MFVPLYDFNPLRRIRFQYVTAGLIVLNCLAYFLQQGIVVPVTTETLVNLAVVPDALLRQGSTGLAIGAFTVEHPYTLLTYMFLHGNLLHLGGNMAFLWVFGDNVEDAMGHVRFFFFYIICGVVAGVVHVAATHAFIPADAPGWHAPMVGASGAVAGVIAAYLMLHPNVRVWVLAFFRIPLRLSAGFVLLLWVVLQVASAAYAYTQKDYGGTAWWAHIGGLAAGAILILFMRSPGVQLFDRATGLEPEPQHPDAGPSA